MNKDHQYYTLAVSMYPRLVNSLLQAGRINQMEANWLMTKNGGPEFNQFVQNVIAQFPCLAGESQMEQLMYNNFFSELIAYARQSAANCNPGMGMYTPTGTPMWGGQPRMPMRYGMGMYGGGVMQPQPSGGGGWYTGARPRPMFTARPPMQSMGGQQRPQQESPKKDAKPPAPVVKWAEPTLVPEGNSQAQCNNGAEIQCRQFVSVDGAPIYEVFVTDSRPIYRDGDEAIASYKHLCGDTGHMFLTVCYRELKLINADRTAMTELIKACATPVSNYPETDAAGRLRAILSVSSQHPAGAVNALHKLIVDEFNEHACCGELVDAVKGHLDWKVATESVEGILALLTGTVDKSIRDALKQIKDFDVRLNSIVTKIISTLLLNGASRKILDPIKDRSILDIYGRIVPSVWRNEQTASWEATPNFFTKYLATLKPETAKTDATRTADQALRAAIVNVDRHYCVLQVPRIITWCNYPSSTVVGWSENGQCIPGVYSIKGVNSDTSFLLGRAVARIKASTNADHSVAPKQLICEVDEGRIRIDYGITTDDNIWCGSTRYRK